jgi:GNAT superfamily N-acetyltransferase
MGDVGDYLRPRAVANRILYSMAERNAGLDVQRTDQFFAARIEEGTVHAVAMCTPPWKGFLGGDWGDDMSALVSELHAFFPLLPAIMGPAEEVSSFAGHWCCLTDGHPAEGLCELWYALDAVTVPQHAAGKMILATADDVDRVAEWMEIFWVEAKLDGGMDLRGASQRAVDAGQFYFWNVGGVHVAMAGRSERFNELVSLGPVFTHPDHRGHGYASNLVATLSQQLLDSGVPRLGLGADRENPVSNTMYERLGFYLVTELEEIRFIQALD